jgi:hypothetical protein
MEESDENTAKTAREAVEAPNPTLEALRVRRDAYAASVRKAAVIYDKLRDELVVTKQRLSAMEIPQLRPLKSASKGAPECTPIFS